MIEPFYAAPKSMYLSHPRECKTIGHTHYLIAGRWGCNSDNERLLFEVEDDAFDAQPLVIVLILIQNLV